MKAEHFTGATFVAVLVTVAAIEQDKLPLLPGFALLAVLIAAFAWGVHKINKEEITHEHTKRKSTPHGGHRTERKR